MLQNPDPSSNTAIRIKLQTKVHFLPNRSARTPKSNAPRDRKSSVRVIAVVIAFHQHDTGAKLSQSLITHLCIDAELLGQSCDSQRDREKVVAVARPREPPWFIRIDFRKKRGKKTKRKSQKRAKKDER